MQNRYLFKGKRKDNGEWVFGGLSYCEKTNAYFITNMGKDHISYIGFHQEVDPETVCQCTGLKDKNGKLILENDIVKVHEDEEPCLIEWGEDTARWHMTQYGSYIYDFDNYWSYEVEVIGNIFDNQELLEK